MSPPDPTYKDIKLLGTKLDTKCDVEARKAKVSNPVKKLRPYFKSRRLSASHKTRLYRTYIEPLLLYNSETWAMTVTIEKSLDSFHRRILRIATNHVYPKIISNENLYALTKEIPLSQKIKKRRLTLFGHVLRLHPETPAQKAIDFYMEPCQRPVGRPPLTWLAQITKDLKNTLIYHEIETPLTKNSINTLRTIANDRPLWREETVRSMESNL